MSTDYLSTEKAREGSKWWIIDATELPIGRLASQAAILIRGKHKPNFTPNVDGGDFVIVVNADKAKLTGAKRENKMYRHYTGYIGGLKEVKAGKILDKKPEYAIEQAVGGMLPEGVLGHRLRGKLKVYAGAEHPHVAQMPETFKVSCERKQK